MRASMIAAGLLIAISACTTSGKGTEAPAAPAPAPSPTGTPDTPLAPPAPDPDTVEAPAPRAAAAAPVLDDADRQAIERTAQAALESNPPDEPLPWQDPANGHSGMVVPGAYYEAADGAFCRSFHEIVMLGGRKEEDSGHACRQPDGTWRLAE
jgi:surface antigen